MLKSCSLMKQLDKIPSQGECQKNALAVFIQGYVFAVFTLNVIPGLGNWIGSVIVVTFSGITSTQD